jgi:hypothetical protein
VRVSDEYIDEVRLDDLKKYVKGSFKANIKLLSAAELIRTYGTHVIAHCYWGGIANLDFISTSSMTTSSTRVEVVAKASAFGVSAKSDNVSETEKSDFKENSSLKMSAYGGNGLAAVTVEQFLQRYQGWVNSIKSGGKGVVCGINPFNETQNMLPIWEIQTSNTLI